MDHTLITSELATFPSDFAAVLIVLASAWSPPEPKDSLPFKSALLDRKCLCSTGSFEKWNISFHISKQGCPRHQQLQPLWIVSWRALRTFRMWKHRVCCCGSVAKSCLALYNPMDCSTPGFPPPSPSPRACSNSYPVSQWCHATISSSVTPFSSYAQSFPASGSFLMSYLFASGGQIMGASASVLPMNIQDWFPLGWTGWISLLSKGLSRVFSNITVKKYIALTYYLGYWANLPPI